MQNVGWQTENRLNLILHLTKCSIESFTQSTCFYYFEDKSKHLSLETNLIQTYTSFSIARFFHELLLLMWRSGKAELSLCLGARPCSLSGLCSCCAYCKLWDIQHLDLNPDTSHLSLGKKVSEKCYMFGLKCLELKIQNKLHSHWFQWIKHHREEQRGKSCRLPQWKTLLNI